MRFYLEEFEAFWAAYPKRAGNPKDPARKQWMRLAHRGQLPPLPEMIAAAKAYAAYIKRENISGEFIAHTRTWLFQKRFEDWVPEKSDQPKSRDIPIALQKLAEIEPRAWAMWLSKCEIEIDDSNIKVKTKTEFERDYIARNFFSLLSSTCKRHVSVVVRA